MKRGLIIGIIVLSVAACFAQRSSSRDASVGGTRDGAVTRAGDSEDPQLKSELKKLSKQLNISTAELRKEYEQSARTYADTATALTGSASPAPYYGKTTGTGLTLAGPGEASHGGRVYFTPQQFSLAKVTSIQQKLPLDQIVAESAKNNGDVSAAATAVREQQKKEKQ